VAADGGQREHLQVLLIHHLVNTGPTTQGQQVWSFHV
jgi:hypothetical protein